MDSVLTFFAVLGGYWALVGALRLFGRLALRRGWVTRGAPRGANRPKPLPAPPPPPESPLVVRNRETMAESERIIRSAYQRTREPTRPAPPVPPRPERAPQGYRPMPTQPQMRSTGLMRASLPQAEATP